MLVVVCVPCFVGLYLLYKCIAVVYATFNILVKPTLYLSSALQITYNGTVYMFI